MKRSDGHIAIGLATCISRDGFHENTSIQVGDKTVLYKHPEEDLRDSFSVCSYEEWTWGGIGTHYRLDYKFPKGIQENNTIIQQVQHPPGYN